MARARLLRMGAPLAMAAAVTGVALRRRIAAALPHAHGARVWVRAARPGPHTLAWADPDGRAGVLAFEVPDDAERPEIRWGSAAMAMTGASLTTSDGAIRCEARALPGVEGADRNPVPALNAGLLTVRRTGRPREAAPRPAGISRGRAW